MVEMRVPDQRLKSTLRPWGRTTKRVVRSTSSKGRTTIGEPTTLIHSSSEREVLRPGTDELHVDVRELVHALVAAARPGQDDCRHARITLPPLNDLRDQTVGVFHG